MPKSHHLSTIKEVIQQGQATLENRLEAEVLFCHTAKISKSYVYAHLDELVSKDLLQQYQFNLALRKKGMPVAYIIGKKEFWSLDFLVNEQTLIPRPETELLVETTLKKMRHKPQATILELGVGSGAIAIALGHEQPQWHIVGTDLSKEALEIAGDNAARHKVTNLTLIQSDWFENIPLSKFDMIVSNPPYIALDDSHLSHLSFEPIQALVSGKDGLDAIRIIIKDSIEYLHQQGWILFEHGYDQGEQVRFLMTQAGYHQIETIKDLNQQERITMGQRE